MFERSALRDVSAPRLLRTIKTFLIRVVHLEFRHGVLQFIVKQHRWISLRLSLLRGILLNLRLSLPIFFWQYDFLLPPGIRQVIQRSEHLILERWQFVSFDFRDFFRKPLRIQSECIVGKHLELGLPMFSGQCS